MNRNNKVVTYACYMTNVCMSIVGNLSPLLFITFRNLYGISYSLLGLLVLINFATQLGIDLIFSLFSHKFNIEKTVKFTPVLTFIGLFIYATVPLLFPDFAYLGIVIGTVLFSGSSGLAEVLISPVIAALPSDNPDKEMSKLHSIYAWGVVFVIAVSTLYLLAFGGENWYYLAYFFMLVPVVACILFSKSKLPKMETPEKVSGAIAFMKKKELWLFVLAIFLGGASECTMAQWSSGYLEQAFAIPKVWGDIFGVALFAVMLGLGRSLYAKVGKHIERVLLLGGIGATVCYLTAVVSGVPVIGLLACAMTGFCVSMLWPGSLIVSSKGIPTGGVFLFAMMAAGGDLGASVGPQLVGVVTDGVLKAEGAASFAAKLGITLEQLGMKSGMLVGSLFPLLSIFVYFYIYWKSKKKNRQNG